MVELPHIEFLRTLMVIELHFAPLYDSTSHIYVGPARDDYRVSHQEGPWVLSAAVWKHCSLLSHETKYVTLIALSLLVPYSFLG